MTRGSPSSTPLKDFVELGQVCDGDDRALGQVPRRPEVLAEGREEHMLNSPLRVCTEGQKCVCVCVERGGGGGGGIRQGKASFA